MSESCAPAPPLPGGLRIAVLGAESTGKTTLAGDIARTLRRLGQPLTLVDEALRRWCDRHGRTPSCGEQQLIAQEQANAVLAAPAGHVVVADTTPLQTAAYSELYFGDHSLTPGGLQHQGLYHLTLLTALDLPWVADGLQRDGPQWRGPVDQRLRTLLADAGLPFRVIYGEGNLRLEAALSAIFTIAKCDLSALGIDQFEEKNRSPAAAGRPWQSLCECCGDPDCERRLFRALTHGD